MARKNPFPKREAEICLRLREFRKTTGLSQVAFARRAELDSTRLSNYEHCRSPLKYGVANRIAEKFDICQRWLATGNLPMVFYVDIAPDLAARLSSEDLFSKAYDDQLALWIDSHIALIADSSGCSEDKVNGHSSEMVGASPAGSRPFEIMQNALVRVARLESIRAGNKSHSFVEKMNSLFMRVFPYQGTSAANENASEAPVLAGQLIEYIDLCCEQLSPERAANFLQQIIHYVHELDDSYTGRIPPLSNVLFNSREPNQTTVRLPSVQAKRLKGRVARKPAGDSKKKA